MGLLGVACVFWAAALAAPADAGEADLLAPGLRIRLRTEHVRGWLEGRVVTVAVDSAQGRVLRIAGRDGTVLSLPLDSVSAMQISTHSRRRPLRGMLIGAGIGLALGVFFWADTAACGCGDDACAGSVILSTLVMSGAAYGAGIGALVKTQHWQPLSVARPPSALAQKGERALGIRLALRF
jgi:hypothetical protein